MVDLKTAWEAPLRRIYLIWGLVLIAGFILSGYGFGDGYLHWYFLSLIGLSSQIIKMRLSSWQSKFLIVIWALISLGGTLKNHLSFEGILPFFPFELHFQYYWLSLLGIPQFITGYLLKNKFQIGLGVAWFIFGLLLPMNTNDDFLSFVLVALVTGVPYLYIAFKR